MRTGTFLVATAVMISALGIGTAGRATADWTGSSAAFQTRAKGDKKLRPFRSEQELKTFFRAIADEQNRRQKKLRIGGLADAVPSPSTPAAVAETALNFSADAASSITNVQHAGVDEGGIVKLHGDQLVVLRRGRLFTIGIGGRELRPVAVANAFGMDIDPAGTWYDEMLISGDTVIVIGYSYQRGGTEIGLFDIDAGGNLGYRATYHLRSNDYYSSRNYSSRLIGTKLVFYAPLYLRGDFADPSQSLPALRKWHKGATADEFRRIASSTRVYRPARPLVAGSDPALHTVTVCDLARPDFDCDATVVMGPPGRVFYVSPHSVYVWTSEWTQPRDQAASTPVLYQMPLDGSAPSALQVSGMPVDQFSFLESEDAHLNVLVRSAARGDAMWRPEFAEGSVALLRVPLDSFSDGSTAAPRVSYRPLAKPEGYTFQNRFVGNYLLYGTGSGWGRPIKSDASRLYAAHWAGRGRFELPLAHGVDRIEAMGSDAVVVGTDGTNLHFTAVRLGDQASVAGSYTRSGASQGELRSHGFFYKPDGTGGGFVGLPISRPARAGYKHLFENSAAILFLRNNALRFDELGELAAHADRAVDDACRASCVDWYGNARPLFIGGRVFGLLGYEIVEGAVADGRLRETQRVSYAPQPAERP
jgi:hypothetical protein